MWEKELKSAIKIGLKASKKVMKIYRKHFDVEIKDDNSPVTQADKLADKLIRKYLSRHYPTYSFLTEESVDNLERLNNDFVWIIDPVDGTKDFVAKDDQFTINIALSYKHEIVVGVVVIPALNEYYFASLNNGAFHFKNNSLSKIHVSDKVDDLTVFCSVFHTTNSEQKVIEKHNDKIKHIVKFGSSLKACRIAEGLGEISYRLSAGTKEWDTAAFTCIVKEAGGFVLKPDGKEMTYNREDFYNREGYIIANKKENILL